MTRVAAWLVVTRQPDAEAPGRDWLARWSEPGAGLVDATRAATRREAMEAAERALGWRR